MSIKFEEHHWLDVTVRGSTARLCVREPNAHEGVRYAAAIERLRTRLDAHDETALEALTLHHCNLLTACIVASEDWTPAFPAGGTEAERRQWVERIPFNFVGTIAGAVALVGYPKISAESDGATTLGS